MKTITRKEYILDRVLLWLWIGLFLCLFTALVSGGVLAIGRMLPALPLYMQEHVWTRYAALIIPIIIFGLNSYKEQWDDVSRAVVYTIMLSVPVVFVIVSMPEEPGSGFNLKALIIPAFFGWIIGGLNYMNVRVLGSFKAFMFCSAVIAAIGAIHDITGNPWYRDAMCLAVYATVFCLSAGDVCAIRELLLAKGQYQGEYRMKNSFYCAVYLFSALIFPLNPAMRLILNEHVVNTVCDDEESEG